MTGYRRSLLGVGLVLFGPPLAYIITGLPLAFFAASAAMTVGVVLFLSGVGLDGRDLP